MQIRPYVFRIWPEGQGVEIEPHSLIVLPLERIGDTQINPHPNIIGSDIKRLVIEVNGLVRLPQMRQCRSYLVHEQVVCGVEH